MRAGLLREKVRFETRSAGDGDGYGNVETGFSAVVEGVSARIRPLRGGETVLAGRLTGVAAYEISTRWTSELAALGADARIVDERNEARVFNIRCPPLNPDERRRELIFTCDTGVAT